jgi:hypothetical protein
MKEIADHENSLGAHGLNSGVEAGDLFLEQGTRDRESDRAHDLALVQVEVGDEERACCRPKSSAMREQEDGFACDRDVGGAGD